MGSAPTNACRALPWPSLLAAGLVLCLYASIGCLIQQHEPESHLYQRLTDSFLAGRLDIPNPAAAEFAALEDPYAPDQNHALRQQHRLHDTSYYQGRIFLYFGVTPVVVLFLPYKLLTGSHLSYATAVLFFTTLGFLANALLLRHLIRAYAKMTDRWTEALFMLTMGIINGCPILAERIAIYEVAIASGFCFLSLSLLAAFSSRPELRHPRAGLAFSGLCLGLALGSRPSLLPAALPLLWLAMFPSGTSLAWTARWWRGLTFSLPCSAVTLGLLVYNYQRFGSLLEFGQSYQLAGIRVRGLSFFNLHLVWDNFRNYFLTLPNLRYYFPYIAHAELLPSSYGPGYVETRNEGMLGAAILCPIACVAPFVLLFDGLRGRWSALHRGACILLVLAVCCYALLGIAAGGAARYYVDFMPYLVLASLASMLGLMVSGDTSRKRGFVRRALSLGCLYSVAATLTYFCSFQNLLLSSSYLTYRNAQAILSQPREWLDIVEGRRFGELHVDLIFGEATPGTIETLLVAEHTPRMLAKIQIGLGLEYLGGNQARFVSFVNDTIREKGPPFLLEEGATRKLAIRFGLLLPYYAHAHFNGIAADQYNALRQELSATLDGRCLLKSSTPELEAETPFPAFGRTSSLAPFHPPFSGKVLSSTWVDMKASLSTPK